MFALFVSLSEKKAIKKTNSVLDRYAKRISSDSWWTPITQEALDEVKKALRSKATRQMAVCCYTGGSRSTLRRRWIVGARQQFGETEGIAVKYMTRKNPPPPHAKTIRALARAAGYAHDLGKSSQRFQDKLAGNDPTPDPVRHEIISWALLKTFLEEQPPDSLRKAWQNDSIGKTINDKGYAIWGKKNDQIDSFEKALNFAVLTHHKLPGPIEGKNEKSPTSELHIRSGMDPRTNTIPAKPDGFNDNLPTKKLRREIRQLQQLDAERKYNASGSQHAYWRGVSIIARAGLILADHHVSGRKTFTAAEGSLAANTAVRDRDKKRCLNQSLDHHLSDVGDAAGYYTSLFFDTSLPGIHYESLDKLREPGKEDFLWQSHSCQKIRSISDHHNIPSLVINLAGTGAGKTIMNLKIGDALRQDQPLRLAMSLNLRTLSRQTAEQIRQFTGCEGRDIALLIGEKSQDIENSESPAQFDGNEDEDSTEVIDTITEWGDDGYDMPDWIDGIIPDNPNKGRAIVGTPVLISTIDYIIKAGEPGRQAHHAHALLRIANSDLVLDEIDSYDPTAFVAVLRLVMMAAMFGRHVIASSATCPPPVAKALFEAFDTGAAMYKAMTLAPEGDAYARIVWVDDKLETQFKDICNEQDIHDSHETHKKRSKRLGEHAASEDRRHRFRVIDNAPSPSVKDSEHWFADTVARAIPQFHDDNAWCYRTDDGHEKRVSVGLIRTANIKPCVRVARHVMEKIENAHVTTYHAADIKSRRRYKEEQLGRLLNRSGESPNLHLLNDPDIAVRIASTPGDDVIFVVVATPVEEVGQDHDFDWAILEPSSMQSIIQASGRVNRHRRQPAQKPNVGILNHNLKSIRNLVNGSSKIVFEKPGNENRLGGDDRYESHAMTDLLSASEPITCGVDYKLDVSLRFGTTTGDSAVLFSREDDKAITAMLDKPVKHIAAKDKNYAKALTITAHYRSYPLRDKSTPEHTFKAVIKYGQLRWERLIQTGKSFEFIEDSGKINLVNPKRDATRCWLCPDLFQAVKSGDEFSCLLEISSENAEFDYHFGGR